MAELSDYAWLTSDEAARRLVEFAPDARSELQQLTALRRDLSAERARLVVEQIALRRRAADKFGDRAATMFFTGIHLEQATDLWIARYKATRLTTSPGEILDLCCGVGGDLLALAEHGPATAYDASPLACLFATANVPTAAATIHCTNVEQLTPNPAIPWHIDPDRRPDGRRISQLAEYMPGLPFFEAWRRASPHGCMKIAPAAELPEHWSSYAEREWISRDRECRQQVAWFGSLAIAAGRRRATVIDRTGGHATFVGDANAICEATNEPFDYLFDPDPAILAADLLGSFAASRNLRTLGTGGAYLVADAPTPSPLTAMFRVHDCLPLRLQELAKYFRQRSVGTLEIKKRGVAVDPEMLRRQLKLRGDNAATLILTRIGRRETAIVAERIPS